MNRRNVHEEALPVALSAVVLFGASACANTQPPQPTSTAADASRTSATTSPLTTQQTQQPATQQPTNPAAQACAESAVATPYPATGSSCYSDPGWGLSSAVG
ncbi:hypothetical protein [Corynebacterium silvaticum]|uniref:hypothetical protein n=1 Tax=Corynebacterium silvaticum TaxID=2320431 RepID=UPI001CED3858|nr:hypothetical protein [Corynebacterium silvaticum]